MAHGQGHSVDEYLETIYFLAFPIGEYRPDPNSSSAIASRVAEMLGVSRASAGEMLKRLEAEGLVERGEHKEAILTETGIERAERVVRKHRIIERLLTDFMGYTAGRGARACRRARRHVLGRDGGADRGASSATPTGARTAGPSIPAFEQRENKELAPLADLAVGREAEIVRLAEHDGELLHWFYDEGFTPGAHVVIREAQPAAGQFKVLLGGNERAIGEKAAAGLYVRPC